MATNRTRADGLHLPVTVSNPASPVSGDPIRFGSLTGIALTDEDEGGNATGQTSVDFAHSVWDVSVKGVDDAGNSAVTAGDKIYYVDADTPKLSKKSSGYLFGIALEAVVSGATTTIQVLHLPEVTSPVEAGAVGPTSLSAALAGTSDGLGLLRVAKATFDPSATAGMRTIGAHGLGVTIPDNAIICGGFIEVLTTFTSATDAGTIAVHAQTANDIRAAVAISTGTSWDAGMQAIVPKANTPESTGIKLTAAREITATVAVEALTAGKATVFIYFVQGD
jgi:hypothetical protein